jgi:hypothetical protein
LLRTNTTVAGDGVAEAGGATGTVAETAVNVGEGVNVELGVRVELGVAASVDVRLGACVDPGFGVSVEVTVAAPIGVGVGNAVVGVVTGSVVEGATVIGAEAAMIVIGVGDKVIRGRLDAGVTLVTSDFGVSVDVQLGIGLTRATSGKWEGDRKKRIFCLNRRTGIRLRTSTITKTSLTMSHSVKPKRRWIVDLRFS